MRIRPSLVPAQTVSPAHSNARTEADPGTPLSARDVNRPLLLNRNARPVASHPQAAARILAGRADVLDRKSATRHEPPESEAHRRKCPCGPDRFRCTPTPRRRVRAPGTGWRSREALARWCIDVTPSGPRRKIPDSFEPSHSASLLILERGPDPQVRRRAWNDVLSVLEADAVEAHQSGLRRQPQVTLAGLKNLEDGCPAAGLAGTARSGERTG